VEIEDWIHLVQDMEMWRGAAKELSGYIKGEEFIDQLSDWYYLLKESLY
jgi:hypothetical protein